MNLLELEGWLALVGTGAALVMISVGSYVDYLKKK